MRLRDKAFQKAFSRMFVYNILFEDAEVDEKYLGIDEASNVLSITGAGCGVAGMISRQPTSLDAVDINPHHLSLSALKITAAQYLDNYETFYDLLGHGAVWNPEEIIGRFSEQMPAPIRRYWKKHHRRFQHNFYEHGLTAWMLTRMRDVIGWDAAYLRDMIPMSSEQKVHRLWEAIGPVFSNPIIKAWMASPLQLLSLGVNFEQCEKMLTTEETDMIGFITQYMTKAVHTDLERNWFIWLYVAGHYNHTTDDAVPPYLRRDRWETSHGAPTEVTYHNCNIFDVLEQGERHQWSHYTLCDMPDWLPPQLQKQLLSEILRTSRDGAVVLYRTTEDDCMADRHGFTKHFKRMDAQSDWATANERTCQYRHVHFYEVHHAA